MLKRKLILALVILFLPMIALAVFFLRQSPVGYWYGQFTNEFGPGRVALVVEKLVDGTFSSRTIGIEEDYGRTLKNITVTKRTFHADYESNGVIDLKMNWVGHSLEGTWKN